MCGRWADTPSNLVIESRMIWGGGEWVHPSLEIKVKSGT